MADTKEGRKGEENQEKMKGAEAEDRTGSPRVRSRGRGGKKDSEHSGETEMQREGGRCAEWLLPTRHFVGPSSPTTPRHPFKVGTENCISSRPQLVSRSSLGTLSPVAPLRG